MKWDFITTFPVPQFDMLHAAGRPSVFEGMEGAELASAVQDCLMDTALAMTSDLHDALMLCDGLCDDRDPRNGKRPTPTRFLEMRFEASHIEHMLTARLNEVEREFGLEAAEAFAAFYVGELAGLKQRIAACPTEQGAGPLFT